MALQHENALIQQQKNWQLRQFGNPRKDFIKRPPYQRKSVWKRKKQKSLMESFLLDLYVPPVVLRSITHDTVQKYEVVDGQQRITAIQEYLNNEYKLADSQRIRELDERHDRNFAGNYYEDLSEDDQAVISDDCTLTVDILQGINDPKNPEHQRLATQVFWRLQQGESLNTLEENHSKITSPVRNYIVERADDISFDYEDYRSLDNNENRHPFFGLLNYGNNRLKHLGLLARFLLIEIADGPAYVTGTRVTQLFDCEKGSLNPKEDQTAFRNRKIVKRADEMLDLLYDIFKDAEMMTSDGKVVYFENEYFIITLYTLIRELQFGNYRFTSSHYDEIRQFVREFYNRVENEPSGDGAVLRFKSNSQQSDDPVAARHWIMMNEFWEYDPGIIELDNQRLFSHAQRVAIFLRDDRICGQCLEEELEALGPNDDKAKAKKRARVDWSDWDADHIVMHAEGGETSIENGQVRCPAHNRSDNII
ncbi:GmrSD restriction endonuclease domain-containing protein [Natrarchaeobius oligotrophus]|uniref:DUF262 domain-containing protein n=1 Tax=Natrarchaeobius chitinivorans TaxID=1679083 RepID=A0A3N6N2G0_NATCH|nr:DUF262 domain-containing protein [Natrarchaeobius chitinivorans]RQH01817.1 DUF262 domain-containing protein [Natrarchaeobius chitinivorans]